MKHPESICRYSQGAKALGHKHKRCKRGEAVFKERWLNLGQPEGAYWEEFRERIPKPLLIDKCSGY